MAETEKRLLSVTRRRLVQGAPLACLLSGARSSARALKKLGAAPELQGPLFDLTVEDSPVNITGQVRTAVTVNGLFPGPTLRLRKGDQAVIKLTNRLKEPTSVHWHGLRLPADMDGTPGLSFAGIMPGETFIYRFPVLQTGTYWYHGHSGMQEQVGLYGALVLDPAEASPVAAQAREHVLVLSDWTDEDPMAVVANLKEQGDYYNYHKRTFGDFAQKLRTEGLGPTLKDFTLWGRMRMSPTDLLDVSGATYAYLVNGLPPKANWTGLFTPGEPVRLRIINASAMTIFDVRIPGAAMKVVEADGCAVEPVAVDEFRIGAAETYDVLVEPQGQAHTIFAQALDRSGFAMATLAASPGLTAPIPPMDPPRLLSMKDMGMGEMRGMASMPSVSATLPAAPAKPSDSQVEAAKAMGMSVQEMRAMPQPGGARPSPSVPVTDASGVDPASLQGSINVDNVAVFPDPSLAPSLAASQDPPGVGGGRRVLSYADLRAIEPTGSLVPNREIVFHLTGNMERWTWGFDGKKFSEAPPVRLRLGEVVRFTLINDTMMAHPIHLHGLFSQLENGQGDRRPLKHTLLVEPGRSLSYLVSADTKGPWAFHCHLLYHMETGMFRTVLVS